MWPTYRQAIESRERGQWNDRLPLIDEDIAEMEQRLASAQIAGRCARECGGRGSARAGRGGDMARCRHQPPPRFRRKEALRAADCGSAAKRASVRMYYRHVNQAERFESVDMQLQSGTYRAVIPAAYTDSHYALQYYFEVRESAGEGVALSGIRGGFVESALFRGAARVRLACGISRSLRRPSVAEWQLQGLAFGCDCGRNRGRDCGRRTPPDVTRRYNLRRRSPPRR